MPGIKKHPWHSFFSKLEQPKCPILKERLGKLWSVSAMEYCAAIKCVSQRMCCSKEKNLCNEKWKKAKQKIILCFNLLNLCAYITSKLREGQGVGWGESDQGWSPEEHWHLWNIQERGAFKGARKNEAKNSRKGLNPESWRSQKLGDNGMSKVSGILYPLLHESSPKVEGPVIAIFLWAYFEQSFKRKVASWTRSQGKGKMGFELRSLSLSKAPELRFTPSCLSALLEMSPGFSWGAAA